MAYGKGTVNKVILIGRVGADPKIIDVKGQYQLATFSLATNYVYKNQSGETITETDWHNIQVWGKLADFVKQYVSKGQLMYLEGRLKTNVSDSDGKRTYFTCIKTDIIELIGGKSTNDNPKTEEVKIEDSPIDPNYSDDLPF